MVGMQIFTEADLQIQAHLKEPPWSTYWTVNQVCFQKTWCGRLEQRGVGLHPRMREICSSVVVVCYS